MLNYDEEQFNEIIGNLNTTANSFNDSIIPEYEKIIEMLLTNGWYGDSTTTFYSKSDVYRKNLETIYNNYIEIINTLQKSFTTAMDDVNNA